MEVSQLQQLNDKLDLLLAKYRKLESDNNALKSMQEDWQQERMKLLQKNDLARSKIEAMISRLKALEQN